MALSKTSGKHYSFKECIPIGTLKQASLYMKHGCQLIDCYWDDNVGELCFVFLREETKPLYPMWQNRTLV